MSAATCGIPGVAPLTRATLPAWFIVPAARFRVRALQFGVPPKTEGAGNAGCTPHPLPYAQNKKTRAGQHRYAEITPALPAQWLYGCSVLFLVYRAF
jgi:hypothetical protein